MAALPFPVVVARGEIDFASANALEDALCSFDAEPVVVVSFEACTFLDPSVLGVLARQQQRSACRLILLVPPESMFRRIFDVTNLAGVLTIVASMNEAISAIGSMA